jgi:hypothetical protein
MKRCDGCPFNDGITEEATHAQNLGCLPTPLEMVDAAKNRQVAISCHMVQHKPCKGLSESVSTEGMSVLPYSQWYRGGKG